MRNYRLIKNIISFINISTNQVSSFINELDHRRDRTRLIELNKTQLLLKVETKHFLLLIGAFLAILFIIFGAGINFFITGESGGFSELFVIVIVTIALLYGLYYLFDNSKNTNLKGLLDSIRFEYYLFDKKNNKLVIKEIFDNYDCSLSYIENVKVYIPPGWDMDVYTVYVFLKDGQKISVMTTNSEDIHKETKFHIVKSIRKFLELE